VGQDGSTGREQPPTYWWAAREGRILLTFDKDFGELAREAALPAGCGIMLFRIPMPGPLEVGQHLADLIMARDDWAGHCSVIETGRVQLRRLSRLSATSQSP
jgi:Domain of unknown function (DUF5615)